MSLKHDVQIISAGSILGLKPSGVERLPSALLSHDLVNRVNSRNQVITVPNFNNLYSFERDVHTKILNPTGIRDFSNALGSVIQHTVASNKFALALGGDCSILIGAMSALKIIGRYGLFFFDAHADFYEPEKSITGEVADMDLALVTGRGPDILTNMNQAKPYVNDEYVIHIGQRDMEETKKFKSQEIRSTAITCLDLPTIEKIGALKTLKKIESHFKNVNLDGFWIHFDTDVLADDINPAVDYRLPGGLTVEQCETILKKLLNTFPIVGMSVTILNPTLDPTEKISENLVGLLSRIFN